MVSLGLTTCYWRVRSNPRWALLWKPSCVFLNHCLVPSLVNSNGMSDIYSTTLITSLFIEGCNLACSVIQKLRPSGFGRVPTCVSAVLNIGHWGGTIIRAFYGAQTLIENLTPLNPSTRPQVYTRLGQGLLERLMQGYNISVLAYGQTGAGKTHTMTAPPGSAANGSARGLIPRLMEDLLRRKQNLELQGKRSSTFINLQVHMHAQLTLLTGSRTQRQY